MSHDHSNTSLQKVPDQGAAMARADASAGAAMRARAQVEARFIVARQNPRDLDIVRAKLMKECKRPSFAKVKVALYELPFGDNVRDVSIRFAEAAMGAMGNMSAEAHVIYDDDRRRIVRVTVVDYENNATYEQEGVAEKVVLRHSVTPDRKVLELRQTSKGKDIYAVVADEREVRQLANAEVSKLMRTCIKRAVPGWLIEECKAAIEETIESEVKEDPDAWRHRIADAFGEQNVTVAMLRDYLGHDLAQATPKEMAELRRVYSTVRDGLATWAECLAKKTGVEEDAKEPDKGVQDAKERVRAKAEQVKRGRNKRAEGAEKETPPPPGQAAPDGGASTPAPVADPVAAMMAAANVDEAEARRLIEQGYEVDPYTGEVVPPAGGAG